MTMAIDSTIHQELNFLGYNASSTTTTTTTTTSTSTDQEQYASNNWSEWSPIVDWEAFSGPQDDFQDLIESMITDRGGVNHHHRKQLEPCYSTSSTWDESNMLIDNLEDTQDGSEGSVEYAKGLRIVHLLMAAAEALSGENKSPELARVILVRLKELVSANHGTNMERLASYFADALQSLLENPTFPPNFPNSKHYPTTGPHHNQSDILTAFQLLQDMSPYVKFGHFTANQAILESVSQEKRIHIVDYDIMEGVQWASFMQALVSRKNGPSTPHLRITALTRPGSNRRSISTVQETGRRLTAFAASIGQPLSFHQCRLNPDETFSPTALKLVRGEALVMNCMLHLPHLTSHRSSVSVSSFLSGSKHISPRLITLVEEEEEEEVTPANGNPFVNKFMDSLHHFSAVCDSLEAGFPMQERARALVERVFLGPRIAGSVSKMYRNTCCNNTKLFQGLWWEWLDVEGFRPEGMSFANKCQAKLLLGLFNDGYRVEELGSNRLVLGWKSRRLLSASIWSCPPTLDSDS